MKSKPILFSTPMVQAILDGNKTQTRRLIKFPKAIEFPSELDFTRMQDGYKNGTRAVFGYMDEPNAFSITPKYQIGDVLWVREAWNYSDDLKDPYLYKQTILEEINPEYHNLYKWKPSIHMPKDAARIFLKVTNVRVELLQDISPTDAYFEGMERINEDFTTEEGAVHAEFKNYLWVDDKAYEDFCYPFYPDAVSSFKSIWSKINGADSWRLNPLVWAYDFDKILEPECF